MRNMLAGLAALCILFGSLGWFRTWYTVGTEPADAGRFAFRVEVNPFKVGSDVVDLLRYAHRKLSDQGDKEEAKEAKVKDEKPARAK